MITEDVVTGQAAMAMHGLFDRPGPAPVDGDPLPPLWHWLAFLPRTPQSALRPDGHLQRDPLLPDRLPPRRVFAGARVRFEAAAAVGAPLQRRSTAGEPVTKRGRSGSLVLVCLEHALSQRGEVVLDEQQDLVYRQAGGRSGPSPEPTLDDAEWDWCWDLPVDPPLLFRFSALTYNAHRIHYDRPYAESVEGYPGLVVHGPLMAMAMAELCTRSAPSGALAAFAFRALAPAFCEQTLAVRGRHRGEVVELAVFTETGSLSCSGTATLRT